MINHRLFRTGVCGNLILSALTIVALSFGHQGSSGDIFSPKGRLISEGRVFSVATHDFDKDGRRDIVLSDYLHPPRILYQDTALEFKKTVALTATEETATTGHGLALRDFNGDGRLDLFLVFNRFPARILFSDDKGGFTDSGRTIGEPGLSGTSVEVADVDLDGDLDVFVTYYRKPARLYLNDGAGLMKESVHTFFDGVKAGNLDGDGDADVLSSRDKGPAAIWLNEKGRFTLREGTVGDNTGIDFVYLVDIDADGDLDLMALNRTAESSIWENDGRASFHKRAQTFGSGTRMAAGDIDLDGDLDLLIGPVVWLNRGGQLFEKAQMLPLGVTTILELVDIDGDGDLDLLAAEIVRETGRADLQLFLNSLRRP